MLLVEAFPRPLDLNELVLLDHGMVHTADLAGPPSLHPPLPVRIGELGVRRQVLEEAIQVLLRAELAEIVAETGGIRFRAGENSEGFLGLLESARARELSERARWITARFTPLNEETLRLGMQSILADWSAEISPVAPPLRTDQ